MINSRSVPARGQRGNERGMRNLLGVLDMFITLIVLMIFGGYANVKIYQIQLFKSVQFIVNHLCFKFFLKTDKSDRKCLEEQGLAVTSVAWRHEGSALEITIN